MSMLPKGLFQHSEKNLLDRVMRNISFTLHNMFFETNIDSQNVYLIVLVIN